MLSLFRTIFCAFFMMGSPLIAEKICPVCLEQSESFNPGGFVLKREQAQCPHCKCLERHRLLKLFLQFMWPDFFQKPLKIFGIAPESGIQKLFLHKESLNYVYEHLPTWTWREFPHMKNVSALNFNYPDGSFDGIICCHVLSHVDDDRASLRELYRLIKPDGWLICMIPYYYQLEKTYEDFSIVDPEERLKHFGQPDHVRKYGKDFVDRLRESGFMVEFGRLKDVPDDIRIENVINGYDDDYERDVARGADVFYCTKASN